MIGEVVVMEPSDFQAWLSGGRAEGSLAVGGREALRRSGAATPAIGPARRAAGRCSTASSAATVALQGRAARSSADEAYIRESILNPAAKIVAGYQPIMPTFQGLVSEEQLLQLIEYVKSLEDAARGPDGAAAPGEPAAGETTPAQRK